MKSLFPGFYSPSSDEYEDLLKNGLVVLDTNVLLTLYRLPATAAEALFKALEIVKERLWIPHQVALEFHRNRISVISSEKKSTQKMLKEVHSVVDNLGGKLKSLRLDERGLNIESKDLSDDLEKLKGKIVAAISSVHASQTDIFSRDEILDKLDNLLLGKIGDRPKDQLELDSLSKDGDSRYEKKIPPGYSDSEKGKNLNDTSFYYDGLRYERRFGDLILWREILLYAKTNEIKSVLFVTDDQKLDWWRIEEEDRIIGVQPELINEIRREAGVYLFWAYRSEQFIKYVIEGDGQQISSETIKEIAEATKKPKSQDVVSSVVGDIQTNIQFASATMHVHRARDRFDIIKEWVRRTEGPVTGARFQIPSLSYSENNKIHAFQVFYFNDLESIFNTELCISVLYSTIQLRREDRYATLHAIFCLPESLFFEAQKNNSHIALSYPLDRIAAHNPIDAITIGSVVDGEFVVLVEKKWEQ